MTTQGIIWIPYALIGVGVLLTLVGIGNWLQGKKLESLDDAISGSKIVWGLWHTGVNVAGERLLKKPQLTRILLPQMSVNNPALVFQTSISGSNDIQAEIRKISNVVSGVNNPEHLRGYLEPFSYAFSIFDKTPTLEGKEYKPTSNKAWVLVQVLEPNVSPRIREKYVIKNKGKENKKRFKEFYSLYERLWRLNIPIEVGIMSPLLPPTCPLSR